MKQFSIEHIQKAFSNVFPGTSEPLVVRSPGRVNIIGEHTDYNEGFVLPAAIDKAVYVAISRRTDSRLHLYAVDFKESVATTLAAVEPTEEGWPNYVLGVVDELQRRGHQLSGFNLLVDGEVPLGAGLSSSAAVECATVFALNELFDFGLERTEMAAIAQKAEQRFAGVNCGIMDQFASLMGKKDHVIKLDCRSLEYEYVPLKLEGYKIVLFNTNVKHALNDSEYNTRRKQCEQGVAWVKEKHPEVNSLRDATVQMLNEHVLPKDEVIFRRCKYVVEEIARLQAACAALQAGDIWTLGKKMFETHKGLSREYEVSCPELDFLVEAVKDNPAVLGARMMGGGFGGCTINLVKEEAVDSLGAQLSDAYRQAMNRQLTVYIAQIEEGAQLISQPQEAAIQ